MKREMKTNQIKCIVEKYEHEEIDEFNNLEIDEKSKIVYRFNNACEEKYLCIKEQEFKENRSLKAGYFIGYRWFDTNKTYLHIKPKIHNGKQADFLAMFKECLSHPIVSQKMDKAYKIFFDEPLIEIQDKKDEITPFLIIHFLQIVKTIEKKGLKKGYIKVTDNLTSKIKGKILVNQTIKQNHFRNRIDKTVCNYQIFTINCLENQILKTALMQCGRYLAGMADKNIIKILKQNITAFEQVDTKEVFDSDFSKIKHSPFYKEYKEALNLAKMIFKRFGFALNNNLSNISNKIPPYYINMPELFERYVELKLLQSNYDVKDGNNGGQMAQWSMRPDFLLPKEKIIADAKYKFWFDAGKNGLNNENSEYKKDYMQLSLYGRDNIIRDILNINECEVVDLLFMYPIPNGNYKDKINIALAENSKKFHKIKQIGVNMPYQTIQGK